MSHNTYASSEFCEIKEDNENEKQAISYGRIFYRLTCLGLLAIEIPGPRLNATACKSDDSVSKIRFNLWILNQRGEMGVDRPLNNPVDGRKSGQLRIHSLIW